MNDFGKRLLAIVVSLVFSLAILELGLRLLEPAPRYADTSVDNLFDGYRLPDDWAAPRESPGIVRVLVIGDSFTWGDGVHEEDAYPHRMQFRMNLHDPERRYRVLNAGRNGLNTVGELELIDELGLLASRPDLVLLGFTLNDPEPSDRTAARELHRPVERRLPVGRVELELYRRSRLVRLIYDRLENSRQRGAFNDYVAAMFDPDSDHWRACYEALTALRDRLRERGIPLLVAVFPAFDAPFDEHYPYAAQHRQIGDALAELGIPAVDLLPLYDGVEARRLAVTPFTDAHPNELAHRIAADFLAERTARCLQVEVDDDGSRHRVWRCPEDD